MEIVKEKLTAAPGYTAVYRQALMGLIANEDCLVLDIAERKKISAIAAKLKAKYGMSFITRKDGDKVKTQKTSNYRDINYMQTA